MRFTADKLQQRIAEILPTGPLPPAPDGGDTDAVVSAGPPSVDVPALLGIQADDQFLREAYRLILGRECDVVGFINHSEMLRNRVPRAVVLHNLVSSEEARQKGRAFTGVWDRHIVAGRLRHGLHAKLRSLWRRPLERLSEKVRFILFHRFDLLDRKFDYLFHELETRTDRLSAKTDQAMWTVSEKLDRYFVDLRAGQVELICRIDQLAREMETRVQQVAAMTSQTIRATSKRLGSQVATLQARQSAVSRVAEASLAATVKVTDLLEIRDAIQERQGVLQHRVLVIDDRLLQFATSLGELGHAIERLQDQTNGLRARSNPPTVLAGGVFFTEVDGFILGTPAEEWRMAAHHTFRGVLEPGMIRLLRRLVKPGMVFVDAGANIGVHTLHAARLVGPSGKVYSFEPTPRTFEILRDNIRVNGLLETGIVMLQEAAVTDRAGTAKLATIENDCGHNTLYPGEGEWHTVDVRTTTLDEALALEERVDVVKIDIEGSEPLLLRGMRGVLARNSDIQLLMEFAPAHLTRAGCDPAEFLKELRAEGWLLQWIDDMTGELGPADDQQLLHCPSSNLSMRRQAGGRG